MAIFTTLLRLSIKYSNNNQVSGMAVITGRSTIHATVRRVHTFFDSNMNVLLTGGSRGRRFLGQAGGKIQLKGFDSSSISGSMVGGCLGVYYD